MHVNAPYSYDASFRILHDRELTGQVYGYDPDGDAITAQLVSGPSHGTLTFHADGSFGYTPNTHYLGADSFTYTWSDGLTTGNTATVSIVVYNNAPHAYGAHFSVLYDQNLTGYVRGEDPDGDAISAQLVEEPDYGVLVFNPDGTFIYEPTGALTGLDRFVYRWSDGLTSSVAEVRIVVYDNIWFLSEEDHRVMTTEELSLGLIHPLNQQWNISLLSEPRFGQVAWSGSDTLVYEFDVGLYEQIHDDVVLEEENLLLVDKFSVLLSGGDMEVVREIFVVPDSLISALDSISPPTRGDGSGRPIHNPQGIPAEDLLCRLLQKNRDVSHWFVMFVDEPGNRPGRFATWHNGLWFGHASVGLVDTANSEVVVYGFHMNGLGRWLSSSFRGSILDNRSYNYDVGRAWPIDAQTYQKLKNWFNQQLQNPPAYTILGSNCFQWAFQAAAEAGVDGNFVSLRDLAPAWKLMIWAQLMKQLKATKDMELQREIRQAIEFLNQLDPSIVPRWYFAPNLASGLRTANTGVPLP